MNKLSNNPNKTGLISTLSVVEIYNTIAIRSNHEIEK